MKKRFLINLIILLIANNVLGQKWTDWDIDSSYSITGCLKVEKFRWNKRKKIKTFERIEDYYNLCEEIRYSSYSKGEAHFRPFYKTFKIKKYDNNCPVLLESKFPEVINNEIVFSINYADSTLLIDNNSLDSISIWINNEWEYNEEGFCLGRIAPNVSETVDLEYGFFFKGWMLYLEFRMNEKIIKRKIIYIE